MCGCARGGDLEDETFARGVEATRAAVRTLNGIVVDALRENGVRAVGVTPSEVGWHTRGRGAEAEASTSGRGGVFDLLRDGAVPVIHGDVVIDDVQGTSVLSGDDIVAWCARWAIEDGFATRARVVFLSDVWGVYASPPRCAPITNPSDTSALTIAPGEDAVLLREIVVDGDSDDGDASPAWRCVRAAPLVDPGRDAPLDAVPYATFKTADGVTDVTGGIEAKLAAALAIARALPGASPSVFLTRAGVLTAADDARDHALDAVLGRPDRTDDSIFPFVGTIVRTDRQRESS